MNPKLHGRSPVRRRRRRPDRRRPRPRAGDRYALAHCCRRGTRACTQTLARLSETTKYAATSTDSATRPSNSTVRCTGAVARAASDSSATAGPRALSTAGGAGHGRRRAARRRKRRPFRWPWPHGVGVGSPPGRVSSTPRSSESATRRCWAPACRVALWPLALTSGRPR